MSKADTKLAGDVSLYLAGLGNQEDGWRLIELAGKVARLERENAELRAHVERLRGFIRTAPVHTGICCCGEEIDKHHGGMDHPPVDMWDYTSAQIIDETPRQSLADVQAEAVHNALLRYAEEWLEPRVGGPFAPGAVCEHIMDHASRLQQIRNGEDNE